METIKKYDGPLGWHSSEAEMEISCPGWQERVKDILILDNLTLHTVYHREKVIEELNSSELYDAYSKWFVKGSIGSGNGTDFVANSDLGTIPKNIDWNF